MQSFCHYSMHYWKIYSQPAASGHRRMNVDLSIKTIKNLRSLHLIKLPYLNQLSFFSVSVKLMHVRRQELAFLNELDS